MEGREEGDEKGLLLHVAFVRRPGNLKRKFQAVGSQKVAAQVM